MASSARNHPLAITLLILTCLTISSFSQEPEAILLLKFKSSLTNTTSLSNWDPLVQLCNDNVSNWNGLLCFNGEFFGLRLESMGLSGNLDIHTLSQLTSLRTMSVMNNNFEGPFPNVRKLAGLRSLFFSNNHFSGELPDDIFTGMKFMRRILMANNEFTGNIPMSLLGVPKLVELQVQDNQFDGRIPAFAQQDLRLNVQIIDLKVQYHLNLAAKVQAHLKEIWAYVGSRCHHVHLQSRRKEIMKYRVSRGVRKLAQTPQLFKKKCC